MAVVGEAGHRDPLTHIIGQQRASAEYSSPASPSKRARIRSIFGRLTPSPDIERKQKGTPLRKRALLQHIWNLSPSSTSRTREKKTKTQDAKEIDQGDYKNPLTTTELFPETQRASPGQLRALDSAELVWGPHADFELRARHTLVASRTPDIVQRAASGARESKNDRIPEQKPIQSPPKTPCHRTSSQLQRRPGYIFPPIAAEDPARKLTKGQLIAQRVAFATLIFILNAACLVAALESHRHLWVLILILFLKAKDILSTLGAMAWISVDFFFSSKQKTMVVSPKWILTCVTAYAETETQIMRTISSIIEHSPTPHKMVLCIILDGKPQNIRSYFTRTVRTLRRPYQTWKFKHGEVNIYTGFMEEVPVIMFEKIRNAGKKDSLILCHDLFDVMRDNASVYTQHLRREIWTDVLPPLLQEDAPTKFDYIFCTDADSLIHEGTLTRLVNALSANPNAIGACGLVLAEMQKGNEWSIWYMFQQFQVSETPAHMAPNPREALRSY